MFRWIPYVFVRVTLFFAAGILLGIYVPHAIPERWAIGALVVLACSYILFFFLNRNKNVYSGFVALLFIFLSGYECVLLKTDSRRADHFIHELHTITRYVAAINSYVQEKDKSWKVEALVTKIEVNDQWKNVTGKVLLYFLKEDFSNPVHYGDLLLVNGSPQLLTPPSNPGEFDYKRFLTFRKIYHQHFLRREYVEQVGVAPPSQVMRYAIQTRSWSAGQLKKYVHGNQAQAIASALVLGVTDGLDNEIMHAYSATGAMHVLAVSGLHVGIIYAILLFFLKPLLKRRWGKWAIAIISLVVLWSYAFVTGLSPSVLRAVTMFSFVAVARPLNRSSNIYNILAVSAFCLLLYDPYLIMSVGFQLSYLAVLGIVYLQPAMYRWWIAPNWLLDKVWQITTVSIAAQAATVSLGLLYFHQFPVYFIFSNLLVIPISFAVLVLGLAVLACSIVPMLAAGIGWVLTWSIALMNGSVVLVEALPYSLLDNIYITTFQSWLIMGLLVSFVLLFQLKRFAFAVMATVFAASISASQWMHYYREVDKAQFVVYNVNGYRAIELIEASTSYIDADSALLLDAERMRFHIRPNRLIHEVSIVNRMPLQPFTQPGNGYRFLSWKQMLILLVEEKNVALPLLEADIVVISNNAISLEALQAQVAFKKVVLDGSNSNYFAKRMLTQAGEGIVHSVQHHGAFIQTL
jgi:competence protein ComEC